MSVIEPIVLRGHVIDKLRELPDESVHMALCSPPYFGLRAYGTEPQIWGGDPDHDHQWVSFIRPGVSGGTASDKVRIKDKDNFQIVPDSEQSFCECGAWRGELGSEPTPELFIVHLVEVFREVKRVLRKDSTLWINMGDSFAGSNKGVMSDGSIVGGPKQKTNKGTQIGNITKTGTPDGCKPKDLIGVPWMLAFALRADGWWLRSDIIWEKPGVMPESVTDRPTKSHEYVFLLAKSERYFYDQDAIREPASEVSIKRIQQPNFSNQHGGERDYGKTGVNPNRSMRKTLENFALNPGRNKRDVWSINTQPFPGAHFAVWPEALVEPMIKAGTSEYGVCPVCGAPWRRVMEKGERIQAHWEGTEQVKAKIAKGKHGATSVIETGSYQTYKTTGWRPTCTHDAAPVPAVCLDPFGGSGTTALVATRLGRKSILIELNPEYAEMARQRTAQLGMAF